MSVGRLAQPLGPFLTDADWLQDFRFWDGDGATPLSFSGCTGSLAFVRRGLPASRFSLTSADGGGLVLLTNGVGIRVAAADMAARVPGSYDFELRRHAADGEVAALLLGQVTLAAGLSAGAPAPVGGGAALPSGTPGVVEVRYAAGPATAVLVPRGVAGASAREAAIGAGRLPPGSSDADFIDYLLAGFGLTPGVLAAIRAGGYLGADHQPTGAVPAHALRLALAADGRLREVLDALSADPADPATIRWLAAAPVTPGDAVAALVAAALDYSAAEMDDLFARARAPLA